MLLASTLQKLCFKLFKHASYVRQRSPVLIDVSLIGYSSVVESTRFQAIMRWGDILRDHIELYVWLFCSQRTQIIDYSKALLHVLDNFRSPENSLSSHDKEVLNRTSLLIDCHAVGLEFLSFNNGWLYVNKDKLQLEWKGAGNPSGEENRKWNVFFQYLLDSLMYVVQYAHFHVRLTIPYVCQDSENIRSISVVSRVLGVSYR